MALLRCSDLGRLVVPVVILLAGCTQKTSVKEEPATKKEATLYQGKPATVWMKQLTDKDVSFRLEAIRALREIGPESDEVVLSLLAVLKDKDRKVQEAAAEAFSAFPPEPTTPVLIQAAKSSDHHTRLSSIILLGRIGPKAKASSPLLKTAIADDDRLVRQHALQALLSVAPEGSVETLILALRGNHDDVRDAAALSLRKLGLKARPALPALKEALKASNADLRLHAAQAIRATEVEVWTVKAMKIQPKVTVTGMVEAGEHEKMQVQIQVRDDQLPLIQMGQLAFIHLDPDQELKGQVVSIGNSVDAITRTGTVRVSIRDSAKSLKPGAFARVEIIVGKERTVLTIPASAIDAGRGKCLVQGRDGEVGERAVVVGQASGEHVEILSGLRDGELIVLDLNGYNERNKHE